MAYNAQEEIDQTGNQQQQQQMQGGEDQAASQPIAVTSAPSPTPSAPQSATSAPASAPQNTQRKGSGRFQNLQKYIQANQQGAQQLGQDIQKNIQNRAEDVKRGIEQSQQQFQQGAQATQGTLNQSQDFAQQLATGTGAQQIAQDENKFGTFRNILTGAVQGPQQNLDQYQQSLQKLQAVGSLPQNEAGRFQLLGEVFKDPSQQYSRGQRRFDQLLLQNTGDVAKNIGKAAQEQFQQTQGQFTQAKTAQQQQAESIKKLAEESKQRLQSAIGGFEEGKGGALGESFTQLKTAQEQAKQQQAQEISTLQEQIKRGRIDKSLAEKYNLPMFLEAEEGKKLVDLIEYAPQQLERFSTGDTNLDSLLKKRDQLRTAANSFTDPKILEQINKDLQSTESQLGGYQEKFGDKISERDELSRIAKFGAGGVNEQSINQYYDNLQKEAVDSTMKALAPKLQYDEGATRYHFNYQKGQERYWITRQSGLPREEQQRLLSGLDAKYDKLTNDAIQAQRNKVVEDVQNKINQQRQADLGDVQKLQTGFESRLGLDLTRFFKPEDLANIAQNVQARDADVTLADVANEEQMSRIAALQKLGGIENINLGERFGDRGANFDFNPVQQNILDIVRDRMRQTPNLNYVADAGEGFKLFDKEAAKGMTLAALANPATAGLALPAGAIGGLSDATKSILDYTGATGNSQQRALNYSLLRSTPLGNLQAIRDVGSGVSKIGKSIASVFCFAKGTRFVMEDGSIRNVEDIDVNDIMLGGGRVYGIGKALNYDVYDYKGIIVSGNHAIIEDDKWIRVKDSKLSKKLDNNETIVYPIVNENHLMVHESGLIASDFDEVDNGQVYTEDERLNMLNKQLELAKKYVS